MLYYTFDVFSSIIFVIISSVFLCHKRHCIEVTIVIPDDDITNLVFDINLIPTSTINQHDKNENLRHRDKFVFYRSHKNVINFYIETDVWLMDNGNPIHRCSQFLYTCYAFGLPLQTFENGNRTGECFNIRQLKVSKLVLYMKTDNINCR